jgi:hypothetical protein
MLPELQTPPPRLPAVLPAIELVPLRMTVPTLSTPAAGIARGVAANRAGAFEDEGAAMVAVDAAAVTDGVTAADDGGAFEDEGAAAPDSAAVPGGEAVADAEVLDADLHLRDVQDVALDVAIERGPSRAFRADAGDVQALLDHRVAVAGAPDGEPVAGPGTPDRPLEVLGGLAGVQVLHPAGLG